MKDTEPFIIKKVKSKGKGVFATRNISVGEYLMHVDLTKLKNYSEKEVRQNPELQSDHCDYFGHGRYVIDKSPASYMNHSCNPNTVVKHQTISIKDVYTFKDIRKGEELTHDYTACSVDQIDTKYPWKMEECKCGSKNCRKVVTGNFFDLPKKLQKKYYPYLPPSIKRKYGDKFVKLF